MLKTKIPSTLRARQSSKGPSLPSVFLKQLFHASWYHVLYLQVVFYDKILATDHTMFC